MITTSVHPQRIRIAARLLLSVVASIGAATVVFSLLFYFFFGLTADDLRIFLVICTVVVVVFGAPLGVWLGRVTADRSWPVALLIHAVVGEVLAFLATGFIGLLGWGTPFGAVAAVAGGAVYRATAAWAEPAEARA